MIQRKHISDFFTTLFTVLIFLVLCNSFFGYLGYGNDQVIADMETKEVVFIIGVVAISAGLSVFLVKTIYKLLSSLKI